MTSNLGALKISRVSDSDIILRAISTILNNKEEIVEDYLRKSLEKGDSRDTILSSLTKLLYEVWKSLGSIGGEINERELENTPARDILSELISLVNKEFVSRCYDTYTEILIKKLCEYQSKKSRIGDLMIIRCTLQSLLIEKHVEKMTFRDEAGELKPLIISVRKDLDPRSEVQLLKVVYDLYLRHDLRVLDQVLYLFSNYNFEQGARLINEYLIATDEESKQKAISEIVKSARAIKRIGELALANGDYMDVLMTLLNAFRYIYPANLVEMLTDHWSRLGEYLLWSIMLRHGVLFSLNAELNPTLWSGTEKNKAGEFDAILLPQEDLDLIFVDVTLARELNDKIQKYGEFLKKNLS